MSSVVCAWLSAGVMAAVRARPKISLRIGIASGPGRLGFLLRRLVTRQYVLERRGGDGPPPGRQVLPALAVGQERPVGRGLDLLHQGAMVAGFLGIGDLIRRAGDDYG